MVCCAGIWGPEGRRPWSARPSPLTPLAHQFAWTGPVGPLAGHAAEATRPVLRHQDADLYYRENGTGLGIGSYRHRPMPLGGDRPGFLGGRRGRPAGSRRVLTFTPEDFEFPLAETGPHPAHPRRRWN